MKKSLTILLSVILLLLSLVGCSSNTKVNNSKENVTNNKQTSSNTNKKGEEDNSEAKNKTEEKTGIIDMNIIGLKGPTSIGMIKLFEKNPSLDKNIKSSYSIANTPDLLIGKLFNNEVDIAALPTNVASVIYNKTEGKYKLAAVNTLGVLYVVTKNNIEINNFEDLKGKKINMSGKGSVPDFAFKYLLKKNNLDAEKDIQLDYSLDHSNLAQAVIAGDVDIALLPQPFVTMVTMKNKDIKIALDIQKEWESVEGDKSTLAMGCIVVKDEFAKAHPEAVDTFLEKYEESVNWVNSNPADAGALVEKFEILPKAKMAELAIPKCNIVFINANDSQKVLDNFFKILNDFNPKAVGGKLPDEGFYYKK